MTQLDEAQELARLILASLVRKTSKLHKMKLTLNEILVITTLEILRNETDYHAGNLDRRHIV